MCLMCWTTQKKKLKQCGDYRVHKANYNRGALHFNILNRDGLFVILDHVNIM